MLVASVADNPKVLGLSMVRKLVNYIVRSLARVPFILLILLLFLLSIISLINRMLSYIYYFFHSSTHHGGCYIGCILSIGNLPLLGLSLIVLLLFLR